MDKWAKLKPTRERISLVQSTITSLSPTVTRTKCDGGCKYGTYPNGTFADCECPKQIPNPRVEQLGTELTQLRELIFCPSCMIQVLPEFKFCPFCAWEQHRPHSECPNWQKSLPFCPNCGKSSWGVDFNAIFELQKNKPTTKLVRLQGSQWRFAGLPSSFCRTLPLAPDFDKTSSVAWPHRNWD